MSDQNTLTMAVRSNHEGYDRRMELVKNIVLAKGLDVGSIPRSLLQATF
jgi:hypothetical protein